jgi:phosphoglycerate dehydrogenase-like enzyme
MGMILMLLTNPTMQMQKYTKRIWGTEKSRIELSGMTVGIIGYGNMGIAPCFQI